MMRRTLLFPVFVMVSAWSIPFAEAQTVPGSREERQVNCTGALSFDEALLMMLGENPALEAAEYEEQAARQERHAATGLFFPTVSVGGSYAYMEKDIALNVDLEEYKPGLQNGISQLLPALDPQLQQAVGGLLGPLMGQPWNFSRTIQDREFGLVGGTVTMPVFMGGKIVAASRAARINEQLVHEQTAQTRNALVSELVERYFGYVFALQVVEVRQMVVDGVRRHLDDALALERNGMIAASERLYVEFKVAEAERELEDARVQLETIRSALGGTLGGPVDAIPATALFVLDEIEPQVHFRQLARDCNPLLNQVEYKHQLAHQNVRVRRAEFFPQVVAVGAGSVRDWQVMDMMPRWFVGVGVNLKIFDGLHREYKYAAARQTERRVGALKQKAGNDVGLLVESLYNAMLNCRNRLGSIESSMTFAEEYLKSKDAAYRAGMSPSTEMIDAELNLAKVRIEHMQAAYNFDVALAKLLEAAGVSDAFADYMHRPDARSIRFGE